MESTTGARRAPANWAPWACGDDGGGAVAHGTLSAADIKGASPRKATRAPRNDMQPPPDPGMHPTRCTRQRAYPQPDTLSVSDIPGATAGHSDWLRPRKQPLNPLSPEYQWLPVREDWAPAPKFVRDTLDVSDIVGSKAGPLSQRTPRGLPSTMRTDDIEGSKPGWRPHLLFEAPRDHMRLDICAAAGATQRQRHSMAAPAAAGTDIGGAVVQRSNSACGMARPREFASAAPYGRSLPVPAQRSPPPGCTLAPPVWPAHQQGPLHSALPEHGVAFTPDWHKQRLEAKVAQAEGVRQARAAADAAISAAATAAAARAPSMVQAGAGGAASGPDSGAGGMSGMMRSLRMYDRDRTGMVQAGELATALHRSGLPLTHGEVAQLVTSVRDSYGSVDYRPFVAKLYGKLGGGASDATSALGAGAGAPPAAGSHMPQFVAARQRRLQTHVGLALNQQPEALAAEAAAVEQLAMPLPWRSPVTKPFSKRMFERQEEFGGGSLSFSGGDPKAAEAALQWRASKHPQHAWAMRRENRPSKQSAGSGAAGGGGSSLPPTPPANRMGAGDRLGAQQAQQLQQAQAAVAPSRRPKSAACMQREAGSPLLAAERAARSAGPQEVALLHSLA